jgi:8-oxo-dGTP diphosphatase
MSYRAAVILIEQGQVALIERHRQGQHYFTFPGGHIDPGETPEQAAVREVQEELGLQVVIQRLLAQAWWQGKPQYYYLVEAVGGEFGTGTAGKGKLSADLGTHPGFAHTAGDAA